MKGSRGTSASDVAVEDVIDAVVSASRALVGVAARSIAAVSEDVTVVQYRTLVLLASRGPQNLAGLASLVGVTPATATRMCDRLVRKRLITRHAEHADRRQIRVALSPRGRLMVDTVTAYRRREIDRILAAIGRDEQRLLVRALSDFARAAGEVSDTLWLADWEL
ncbi:MAG: MarR family winged helix-turn-helix transcriptional regulator [Acidimicrobiales bacterium]